MHCVNSNIREVMSPEGEELPANPDDVVVVVGLDPALATPGDAERFPQAARNTTKVVSASPTPAARSFLG